MVLDAIAKRYFFPFAESVRSLWRMQVKAKPVSRGFTLLEVAVSIALLSLVLGVTYSSFAVISSQGSNLRQRLIAHQQSRLLVEMIAADLRAIRWLPHYALKHESGLRALTQQRNTITFSQLNFHAARPALLHREQPHADPRLHEIGYTVEPDDQLQNFRLIRREDYYLDDNLQEGGRTFTLTKRLRGFQVEFLQAVNSPWRKDWHSSNQPQQRMPLAIRFTLTLAPEDDSLADPQALEVYQIEINLPIEIANR